MQKRNWLRQTPPGRSAPRTSDGDNDMNLLRRICPVRAGFAIILLGGSPASAACHLPITMPS